MSRSGGRSTVLVEVKFRQKARTKVSVELNSVGRRTEKVELIRTPKICCRPQFRSNLGVTNTIYFINTYFYFIELKFYKILDPKKRHVCSCSKELFGVIIQNGLKWGKSKNINGLDTNLWAMDVVSNNRYLFGFTVNKI